MRMIPIRPCARTRADAGTLLARALIAAAARAGVAVTVHGWRTHPWASATFIGARHRAVLTVEGIGADAWLATLAEADLPVRGHLVAGIVARTMADGGVTVEALTLEET